MMNVKHAKKGVVPGRGPRSRARLRRLLLPIVLVLLLFNSACALLSPPQLPTIPTPIPPPPAAIDFDTLELVTNPNSSTLSPLVDPDILTLVNNVSRQQLFGYVQTLEGFGTRHSLSETQRPDFGVGAARTWIADEFNRVGGGRLQVTTDDFTLNYNGLVSSQQNIVATLPGVGTYPGMVVLAAHYDSRNLDIADGFSLAPGANDNASGVAALIETARLLSSRTWNQTIMFIAFASEEQGTHGSFHFVQQAMLGGRQFDAVFNMDIVGGRPGIPQSLRIFAVGPETSPSSQVARYLRYVGGMYLPTFPVDIQQTLDREGRYSDHREFINAGVGAVRMTESVEDVEVQHTSRDTSDRLDYDYLAKVTQLNVATVASLAGAPGRPAAPTITQMADPGAYLLTWSPDPQAAGYALSFRPVDSYDYPLFQFVNAADAGNVAITGLNPTQRYYVSMGALDANGRLSFFSEETLIGP